MQFLGPKAANVEEFNAQFAQYEGAVDDIKPPELYVFLKNNEEYLRDLSVNKGVRELCGRIKVTSGEGAETLKAINIIVSRAVKIPVPIETTRKDVMGVIGSNLGPKAGPWTAQPVWQLLVESYGGTIFSFLRNSGNIVVFL